MSGRRGSNDGPPVGPHVAAFLGKVAAGQVARTAGDKAATAARRAYGAGQSKRIGSLLQTVTPKGVSTRRVVTRAKGRRVADRTLNQLKTEAAHMGKVINRDVGSVVQEASNHAGNAAVRRLLRRFASGRGVDEGRGGAAEGASENGDPAAEAASSSKRRTTRGGLLQDDSTCSLVAPWRSEGRVSSVAKSGPSRVVFGARGFPAARSRTAPVEGDVAAAPARDHLLLGSLD